MVWVGGRRAAPKIAAQGHTEKRGARALAPRPPARPTPFAPTHAYLTPHVAHIPFVAQEYDVDGSGAISFGEFLRMFRAELLDLNEVLSYLSLTPSEAAVREGAASAAPHAPSGPGEVTDVYSEAELNSLLESRSGGAPADGGPGYPDGSLTVLLCTVTWCRPCKALAKPYLARAGGGGKVAGGGRAGAGAGRRGRDAGTRSRPHPRPTLANPIQPGPLPEPGCPLPRRHVRPPVRQRV